MELILQRDLPHQQKAVNAISNTFNGVHFEQPKIFYENPIIPLSNPLIEENIQVTQKYIPSDIRNKHISESCLNLDIKMETGTGKTYVYINTIYELHKRYGLNKFIIVVPSLAIKAGTGQFLQDEYVSRHFTDVCGYGTEIKLGILEANKSNKKGRSFFPSEISDFVKGSCQDSRKIFVLLLNMQLLTSGKMLKRDDYDYGVEGFFRPMDAIKATRPIVIIDEPHRFSREQKAFKVITDEIMPQCIIRFGATFPEISIGRGKNRKTIKDYTNLLYDLNACESFNQNLIKGVTKEHFEPVSKKEEKLKITTVVNKDYVIFQHKKRNEPTKSCTLKRGDPLSIIHEAFEGITIDEIKATSVSFSNGIEKSKGEEIDVDIYMSSYQEQMIRLALDRHFETEKGNFCQRSFKIKTLALFFIDDISSYRESDNGRAPFLLQTFEKLLKEHIEVTLSSLSTRDSEYRAYLEASLGNIRACHAGYFSQDNSDSDDDIAKEVEVILHGKKELLSIKNNDGTYNTLRFLFSKWTLKEGWDNPNVFTIAKLRSSGSEISKLQEVGRGLRLPVDENGNRISNEEFQLNYIVDFTEADFAQKLVEQINGEIPQTLAINDEQLEQVARKLGITPDDLFSVLLEKQYIDRHMNIKTLHRDEFFTEYPDFATGLASGKVKDRNREKPKQIKIRSGVYAEIKKLWEAINQRYLMFFDKDLDTDMENVILSLLENQKVFSDVSVTSIRERVSSDGNKMEVYSETGVQYITANPIPYNEFLIRIMRATNLPIKSIHSAMCNYVRNHGEIKPDYINDNTASMIIRTFYDWKNENLQGRFKYIKSKSPVKATALSYEDGSPREEITQGRIGTKLSEGTPCDKYLYDSFAYDSPLEKQNILTDVDEIIVYGKIPRNSIAIPTITGERYSPDFMYIIKRPNGDKEMNIVVETKDVEGKSNYDK
jgi:type III restriction enzyme